jgi:hypothetical protein
MQYYTFPISVQAYSEAEAKAKLNLLLALGSFFVDFEIGDLAGAFVKSKLLECAGKVSQEKANRKFDEFLKLKKRID